MKTQDRISLAIQIGFTTFYAVALLINAIQAIAGTERLAVWHYGFFALTVLITWNSVPVVTRCRYIVISKRLVREAAQLTLGIHSRADRSSRPLLSRGMNAEEQREAGRRLAAELYARRPRQLEDELTVGNYDEQMRIIERYKKIHRQ